MSAPAASPEAVKVAVAVFEEFPTNPDDSEVCILLMILLKLRDLEIILPVQYHQYVMEKNKLM